jgi:hypothetical protein
MLKNTYAKQSLLNQELLKELVNYDPNTGVFAWKKIRPGVSSSKKFGSLKPSGYIVVLINKKLYRLHRLAWLYMTGEWPENEIDHINGNKADNRFCNIRKATKAENNWNKKVRKDSTTGVKNVLYYPKYQSYYVRITANKIAHSFGPFKTKDQAALVAKEKRAEIHKNFHTQ